LAIGGGALKKKKRVLNACFELAEEIEQNQLQINGKKKGGSLEPPPKGQVRGGGPNGQILA